MAILAKVTVLADYLLVVETAVAKFGTGGCVCNIVLLLAIEPENRPRRLQSSLL